MPALSPERQTRKRLAVSITDAAEMIDCSRPFVYTLIEEGKLTPVDLAPRVRRIPLEQIHALLGIEADTEAITTV
jgi:excisionase family DNA binding protein